MYKFHRQRDLKFNFQRYYVDECHLLDCKHLKSNVHLLITGRKISSYKN